MAGGLTRTREEVTAWTGEAGDEDKEELEWIHRGYMLYMILVPGEGMDYFEHGSSRYRREQRRDVFVPERESRVKRTSAKKKAPSRHLISGSEQQDAERKRRLLQGKFLA